MEALSPTGANDNSGGNNRGRSFDFQRVLLPNCSTRSSLRKTDQLRPTPAKWFASGERPFSTSPNAQATFDLSTCFGRGCRRPGRIRTSTRARATTSTRSRRHRVFDEGRMGIMASVRRASQRNISSSGGSGTVRWCLNRTSGGFDKNVSPPRLEPGEPAQGRASPLRAFRAGQACTCVQKTVSGMTGSYQWQDHRPHAARGRRACRR